MLRKLLLLALISAMMAVPSLFAQGVPGKATTFSFASDDEDSGPTFISKNADFVVNAPGSVFDLMVDVNDDNAGGLVTFQSVHNFQAQLYDYNVIRCGASYLHIWKAKGVTTFSHFDAITGFPMILTITFSEAVFISYSPGTSVLGETATLQSSLSVDPGVKFAAGTQLIGIGVPQSDIADGQDFAYTLTNIRAQATGAPFPKLDAKGEWAEEWQSEGSFSAAANP